MFVQYHYSSELHSKLHSTKYQMSFLLRAKLDEKFWNEVAQGLDASHLGISAAICRVRRHCSILGFGVNNLRQDTGRGFS